MIGKERNVSLDVIRLMAFFSVISVHYFFNSGFYGNPVKGTLMYLLVVVRQFFMICVPLFLLLTGYLMSPKSLSKGYYLGIRKTLFVYVAASILSALYKNFYVGIEYGIKETVLGTLGFTASNYAWYMEMYIGLFLIIPFLNLIYKGLENKKQKQMLIITLFVLTSIPTVLNIFNFNVESWWLHPALSNDYQKIVPSWWMGIYPITFYFIGSYLKEFELKLNKKQSFLILGLCMIIGGTFCYYRSYGEKFVWGIWSDYNSVFVLIMSVIVFHIILQVKSLQKLPKRIKKCLGYLSDLVLGAYLVSWIFDSFIYQHFIVAVDNFSYKFGYYFICVPVIFILSMICSALISMVYKRCICLKDYLKKAS